MNDTIELIKKWFTLKVSWKATETSPFIFHHQFDGKDVLLRINDFPDEPACSILIDGDEFDMEELPPDWKLPSKKLAS